MVTDVPTLPLVGEKLLMVMANADCAIRAVAMVSNHNGQKDRLEGFEKALRGGTPRLSVHPRNCMHVLPSRHGCALTQRIEQLSRDVNECNCSRPPLS